MSKQRSVEEIVELLWWSGWSAHKASLIRENTNGIRSLEDGAKQDAKAQIAAIVKYILGENETKAANFSDARYMQERNYVRQQQRNKARKYGLEIE